MGTRGPWLPSSSHLFAAVVLATACTVLVSCYTSQNNIATHAVVHSNGPMVLVVGSLLGCQGTEQMSLQQLTAAAQQTASQMIQPGSAAALSAASGHIQVGCSMQLHPQGSQSSTTGNWQQGPYQQQQELQVADLDALDCILHEEQSTAGVLYIFLLQSTGGWPTAILGRDCTLLRAHLQILRVVCSGDLAVRS
jgi:hypothetical protein